MIHTRLKNFTYNEHWPVEKIASHCGAKGGTVSYKVEQQISIRHPPLQSIVFIDKKSAHYVVNSNIPKMLSHLHLEQYFFIIDISFIFCYCINVFNRISAPKMLFLATFLNLQLSHRQSPFQLRKFVHYEKTLFATSCRNCHFPAQDARDHTGSTCQNYWNEPVDFI